MLEGPKAGFNPKLHGMTKIVQTGTLRFSAGTETEEKKVADKQQVNLFHTISRQLVLLTAATLLFLRGDPFARM